MKKENFFLEKIKKSKNYSWYEKNTEARIRLAKKILSKRKENNLSQQELAKKAKTTQSIISEIESADYNIGIELLNRIITILKMNDQDLGELFNAPVSLFVLNYDDIYITKESVIDDENEAIFNLNN